MSQADSPNTTNPSGRLLSALFVDSVVADAFRRAERGPGMAFAVSTPSLPGLAGGGAVAPPIEAGEPSETGHAAGVRLDPVAWEIGRAIGHAGFPAR
jgi:hypothetical protein